MMATTMRYQYGFSAMHADDMYNVKGRTQKATKIMAVISDYIDNCNNKQFHSLLDIGCSTGIMTVVFSKRFEKVVGIDIDSPAVEYAMKNNCPSNVTYLVRDALNTGFADESFDVIVCNHIYEHVPDAKGLLDEIYRLLRGGGVCYFAAGNRFRFMEEHYKLPFLSVLPKSIAHLYLRLSGKGDFYYENHLTVRELRKIVSKFEIIDYTIRIVKDPVRYCSTDVLPLGSLKQKISSLLIEWFYWFCPTYVWVLRKR